MLATVAHLVLQVDHASCLVRSTPSGTNTCQAILWLARAAIVLTHLAMLNLDSTCHGLALCLGHVVNDWQQHKKESEVIASYSELK